MLENILRLLKILKQELFYGFLDHFDQSNELHCDPQTKGCTLGIRIFIIFINKVSSTTAVAVAVALSQQLANRVTLRAVSFET